MNPAPLPTAPAAQSAAGLPESADAAENSIISAAAPRALIVLTNLPDEDSARTIARLLIEQRLAACVNILSPCHSVYSWRSTLEESTEVPLLIKTTHERYAALEATLLEHHPYELPEIVAIPIVRGLPGYLDWVTVQTL